jgi:hypothetical protein
MRAMGLVCAVIVSACGASNQAALSPPCGDGIDNDGDGATDFPADLGCTSPQDDSEDSATMPRCSDGRDNDDDGHYDYPDDPGCFAPQSDEELDDCPDGPHCPQCGNGQDDNDNGKTDFPEDPGCTAASDVDEVVTNPIACGSGMTIKPLPASGMDSGILDATSVSDVMSPCGGGGGSPAYAYALHLTEATVVSITTNMAGTTADTVIDIRSANCTAPSSHIACNDDVATENQSSMLTRALDKGTYFIIISGHDPTASGTYSMQIGMAGGANASCTSDDDCGAGFVCRPPNGGGSGTVCQPPMCSDEFDNDGDGKIDHPLEPGCSSPADNDETDTCPGANEPECAQCSDGIDNDGDGKTDFPTDTSCKAAGDSSEACVSTEAIEVLTQPMTTGTTVGASHDFDPTCNSSSAGPLGDRLYRLDLPPMATLDIDLTGLSDSYDSVLALLGASCGGTALACEDDPEISMTSVAAGTYYLVVDGWSAGDEGSYTIAVSGTVTAGGSCEGALFRAGALSCADGFTCDGPAGARTCGSQCSDGIDNNNDGKRDYPFDPGCSAINDNSESTVCPGAGCPKCSNQGDDDGDQLVDYPTDFGCTAAGSQSEMFCAIEPDVKGTISARQTTGTLAGVGNNYDQSCQGNTGNDVAFGLQLPVPVLAIQIDTIGSTIDDTALSLHDASCGTEIGCDDDSAPGSSFLSMLRLNNLPAGNYAIQVDGYGTTNAGAFKLNVKGVVATGTTCTGPLFTAGVLACVSGTSCVSGKCQ